MPPTLHWRRHLKVTREESRKWSHCAGDALNQVKVKTAMLSWSGGLTPPLRRALYGHKDNELNTLVYKQPQEKSGRTCTSARPLQPFVPCVSGSVPTSPGLGRPHHVWATVTTRGSMHPIKHWVLALPLESRRPHLIISKGKVYVRQRKTKGKFPLHEK